MMMSDGLHSSVITLWRNRPLVANLLTALGGAILGGTLKPAIDKWWENNISLSIALAAILILLFALLLMWANSIGLLWDMRARVGIKVTYHPADASGSVYDAVREVVAQATRSVLVLNSYLVERKSPNGEDAKKKYYQALMNRVNAGIKYQRLLQFDDALQYVRDLQRDDPIFMDHLTRMDESTRTHQNENTSVKSFPPTRFTNFVLVDDVYLVWQINEVGPDRDDIQMMRTRLHGAFIFHDPQAQITKHFKRYFRTADNKASPFSPAPYLEILNREVAPITGSE